MIISEKWFIVDILGLFSPIVWKVFFRNSSMDFHPVFWNVFFYSSRRQMIRSNLLEGFLQLDNEKIKRDFSLDVYLITLTIHRWDSFAGCTCFGFLLHKVLIFLVKQFSNFNMSDELGACALTVYLAMNIFFHRSNRGCLY